MKRDLSIMGKWSRREKCRYGDGLGQHETDKLVDGRAGLMLGVWGPEEEAVYEQAYIKERGCTM